MVVHGVLLAIEISSRRVSASLLTLLLELGLNPAAGGLFSWTTGFSELHMFSSSLTKFSIKSMSFVSMGNSWALSENLTAFLLAGIFTYELPT